MSAPESRPQARTPNAAPPRPHPHKGRTGLERIVRATGHSLAGLREAYRTENAFRQEAWLALVLCPGAFWLGRGWLEVALLLAGLVLVLVVELLNSAVEAAIDRIGYETHPLAKRAKDYASAAVMLSLLACAGLWLAVLWQRVGA
ncbi:MAG: hypothetical protein AMXMBFR66_27080 [Pseudomonadota bacterium]|nr:diacylglycerol kinase [Rubrivivax sp.]NLZ41082.1 diacylglycerol kinase [Comamonadaceae bacterium]